MAGRARGMPQAVAERVRLGPGSGAGRPLVGLDQVQVTARHLAGPVHAAVDDRAGTLVPALLHVAIDTQGERQVVVTEVLGQLGDAQPVGQTGRERFTNHVEYLKLSSGEMGVLVLVDASFPLPQVPQAVT